MADDSFTLSDLRITVDRIEGRSVCGLRVGDYFDIEQSSHVVIPAGKHFCAFAMASVLPFLAAKQRAPADGDWLASDDLFACPDPDERLIMRVERTTQRTLRGRDLT